LKNTFSNSDIIIPIKLLNRPLPSQLDQRLNQVEELNQLEREPLEFWVSLIRSFLVEAPHIVIRGVPSVEEQKRLAQEEDERLAARVKALGKSGLNEKNELLMKSTEENEVRTALSS
jgi:Predicted Zn-dependent peptidases, insulinase-like